MQRITKKNMLPLCQKVSGFKEGLEKGKMSLTIEVINFLSDWLKKHIMGTDKKYSQFFNEKGFEVKTEIKQLEKHRPSEVREWIFMDKLSFQIHEILLGF